MQAKEEYDKTIQDTEAAYLKVSGINAPRRVLFRDIFMDKLLN